MWCVGHAMRDKRKKFVELAEARVNKTIKNIRLIGNLSNKSFYEYSKDDVSRIFRTLQKELDAAKSRYVDSGQDSDDSFRLRKQGK